MIGSRNEAIDIIWYTLEHVNVISLLIYNFRVFPFLVDYLNGMIDSEFNDW